MMRCEANAMRPNPLMNSWYAAYLCAPLYVTLLCCAGTRGEEAVQQSLRSRFGKCRHLCQRDGTHSISVVFEGNVDAGKSTLCSLLWHKYGAHHDDLFTYLNISAGQKMRIVNDPTRRSRISPVAHVGGITQPDLVVYVVSARRPEFECGLEKLRQRPYRQEFMARFGNVRKLVCVINKMDLEAAEDGVWDEVHYQFIVAKLRPVFNKMGFGMEGSNTSVEFIPISTLENDNVFDATQTTPAGAARGAVGFRPAPWYCGPSLMGCLCGYVPPSREMWRQNADVVFLVSNSLRRPNGRVDVVGVCESGSMEPGDKLLLLLPSFSLSVIVESYEFHGAGGGTTDVCRAGDIVSQLRLHGLTENATSLLGPGCVIASPDTSLRVVEYIQARVTLFDEAPVCTKGCTLQMHTHTAVPTEVIVDEILATVTTHLSPHQQVPPTLTQGEHPNGVVVTRKRPLYVKAGETVVVRLELARPLVVQEYVTSPRLGRFVLCKESSVVGLGFCTKLYKSTKEHKLHNLPSEV